MELLQHLKRFPGKFFLLPIIGLWLAQLRRLMNYKMCIIFTLVIIIAWFIFFLIKTKRGEELKTKQPPGVSPIQKELTEIEKKLEHVISVVRDSKIGQRERKRSTVFEDPAPYILPWYMVIGKKDCGKTTMLMKSELPLSYSLFSGDKVTNVTIRRDVQINPTLNCDCFLAEEAVILDTTGRYFLIDEKVNEEDREEWLGFLKLLKKYRPQKPIDGLLFAVDISTLLNATDDDIKEEAEKSRNCIDEVIEHLGIRFPIYLVFTKCDSLYGFTQFFEGLGDDKRNQIWGYTVSVNEQREANKVFEEACEQLEQPLNAFRMMVLAKETTPPKNRREIVVFPLQFTEACKKLKVFVSTLFQPDQLRKASLHEPMLRGFYFSSGTQEGEPIDLVIHQVDKAESFDLKTWIPPGAPKETKGYFIKDIFTKVIIPDKDLDKPSVSGWSRILRIASLVALIIIFTVLATWITASYVLNRQLLIDARESATNVKNIDPSTKADVILSRLDDLQQKIAKLEGFHLLWGDERNNMAAEIGKIHYERRFKYTANIQVKVLKKADNTPIPDAIVYFENSPKSFVTSKEGLANTKIAHPQGEHRLTIELPNSKKTKTIPFQIGKDNPISVVTKDAQGGLKSGERFINVFF